MKNKILRLALSLFVTFGVMAFSHAIVDEKQIGVAKAEELVGTPYVDWNNIDYAYTIEGYTSWSGELLDNHIPKNGYCFLAKYPSNISADSHYSANLIISPIVGCNVDTHILINGVESQYVNGAVIYCFPTDGLFVYVPQSSVTFNEQYEYLTIDVLEGMSIDGSAQTVATRFEYRGLLHSSNKWKVNPDPLLKVNGEFNSINWNNRDYSFGFGEPWSGELTVNAAPKYGYCLLAFFNEEGKTDEKIAIGDSLTIDRGVIGIGLDADYKIKVNGVNIIDVPGALCYIYPEYGLYFYIPDASLSNRNTYKYPLITIENGVHFNNVILPAMAFEFRGELGELNCWVHLPDYSQYNSFDYVGIAGGWNNVPLDGNYNQTILQFGEYGVDYLKNDKTNDATNLVTRYSDCGTRITVNDIPLWKLSGSIVSYAHGYCYVYVVLPISALQPSNGYKVVTLHIAQNTIFHDTALNEVTLYLYNGRWTATRPDTPNDSDYSGALTFSNVYNVEAAKLDSEHPQLSGIISHSLNSFNMLFDYKVASSDSSFVLYALGNTNQNGLRIVFLRNTISLYDTTDGNVLLATAELSTFIYDDWYTLLFFTSVNDNKLSISIAIDGISYIHVEDVSLTNMSNIGNLSSIYLGNGSASFKNSILGTDNKKPVLSYTGKSRYSVLVGGDVIDFTNKCSAYDFVDGNVTELITFNWPEGSITNNKLNKGVWEVSIIATDTSHNESIVVVIVIVADKLEVTVTFDGTNPVTYRVGDYIASVTNPVKDGYRFVGWYFNDKPWDFENDYVISDMDLVSRYQQITDKYTVTFTIEGLKEISSYTLYFEAGATLDLQTLAKEGYTLTAYVNDTVVDSITVNGDMDVKLVYNSTKRGCMGSITTSTTLISVLSGMAFFLLVFLKKRGGKEHE